MKKLFTLGLFLLSSSSILLAQNIITACCDTIECQPGPITLTATVDTAFGTASSVANVVDDTYSQVIDIGFPFVYWGNTYTQCIASTNAYINFDIGLAGQYSPWPIGAAIPSPADPVNSIMGPWHDVLPDASSALYFLTVGTAPNRRFIFSFCSVPMYQCIDTPFTGQIILYETSNVIEVHLGEKRVCYTWNGGAAIEGLQNSDGTQAVVVTGRNYPTQWTAFSDGIRFTPNSSGSYDIDTIPYAPVQFFAGSVTWKDINGNILGTGNTLNVNPTTTTQYIATTSNCFFTADTVTVTIGPPTPDFSTPPSFTQSGDPILSVGDTSYYCAGSAIGFTNNSQSADSVYWTFGDGGSSSALNPVHQYDTTGLYEVTLYVYSDLGCYDSTIKYIRLLPTVIQANFSNATEPYCPGDTVYFTDITNSHPITWDWDFDDGGSTSQQQDPSHQFTEPGTYNVTLAVTDSVCGGSSVTLPIVIGDFPDLGLAPEISGCPGDPVVLAPANQADSYLWSTGETTSSITVLVADQPTMYTLEGDVAGCIGRDTIMVTIGCNIYVPNAFSPNGDGTNDILHILGSTVLNYTMQIYNRWGEEIYSYTGADDQVGWNGTYKDEPQDVGVYVYHVAGNFSNGDSFDELGNVTLVR